MMVLALFIRVTCGSPVLFRQRRPGRSRESFVLFKFRSMTDERDENGLLLPDEERLTAFGRFLRRTSLDELPSLLNVLRGEMSLVGPRPLLIRYLPYFTETEQRRMDVLPGITGWAQIHGRNELPWDERLARDVWYVRNLSITLDIRILVTMYLRSFEGRVCIWLHRPGCDPWMLNERKTGNE